MAEGVRRSAGRVMQTGSSVGRGVASRVCSKSFFASSTGGRMSSFAERSMGTMSMVMAAEEFSSMAIRN